MPKWSDIDLVLDEIPENVLEEGKNLQIESAVVWYSQALIKKYK